MTPEQRTELLRLARVYAYTHPGRQLGPSEAFAAYVDGLIAAETERCLVIVQDIALHSEPDDFALDRLNEADDAIRERKGG